MASQAILATSLARLSLLERLCLYTEAIRAVRNDPAASLERYISLRNPWESVTFGTDNMRGNYIIVSGKPPTGGSPFKLTKGETYDDSNAALVQVERLIHHVDQKLTTTPQCTANVAAIMLQEQRMQISHMIVVPANPALQMYDGVTVNDYTAPQGSGQNNLCRII